MGRKKDQIMNIAIVLSGGTGTRLGAEVPKQYIQVNGKTIISYCLDVLESCEQIDAVQIVADTSWHDVILESKMQKFKGFSKPGENRQRSIFNALEDIKGYAKEDDVVIIHDAARPCVSEEVFIDLINACKEHDGALPVLPMKDTVYLSEDGRSITSLLNRSQIFAGQAPEAFHFGKYYEANMRLLLNEILEINGSTEPAVMAGMDVAMISGDEKNFKITTVEDLERFWQLAEEV